MKKFFALAIVCLGALAIGQSSPRRPYLTWDDPDNAPGVVASYRIYVRPPATNASWTLVATVVEPRWIVDLPPGEHIVGVTAVPVVPPEEGGIESTFRERSLSIARPIGVIRLQMQ